MIKIKFGGKAKAMILLVYQKTKTSHLSNFKRICPVHEQNKEEDKSENNGICFVS